MVFDPSFDVVLWRAQEGDARAFESIYRACSTLVLGYLRASNCPDPEDVTGDVFVSVVRDIGRFEGDEEKFRSWLLTIAHRRMVDEIRRRGRRWVEVTSSDDLARTVATRPGADVEAADRLAANGILAAIDNLTPEQRQVVMLRVVADLPIREIAHVVGKPETAVKSLLHRGMARLQKALVNEDGNEADHEGEPE